jgi:hypothetical protein
MQLSYFTFTFDLIGIGKWLSNQSEIAPEWDKHQLRETAEYQITLLPSGRDGYVFFHTKNNEFSTTLNAADSNIDKYGIEDLEFTWRNRYFELLANGTAVFAASDKDVVEVLTKEELQRVDNLRAEFTGTIIDSGIDDMMCSKIKRQSSRGYIKLSNSLASVSVSVSLRGNNTYTMLY